MDYGIEKYKSENKIDIRVESTRGKESVKTFSIYSQHGNGRMMLRTSRGVLVSMNGHSIRSTAFKPKKLYDVIELNAKRKFSIVMSSVGLSSQGKSTGSSADNVFENKEDAKGKAKRLNKLLSVGEKKFYKCKYKVVEV